jgi:sporulation protein YlmC with PRC-barrel domain
MKLSVKLLASAILAFGASFATAATQPEPSHTRLGAEKQLADFTRIEVKNFEDESLGRIKDLGIDLVNGRIVEVLIVSDDSLDVKNKIVAVPPLALYPDLVHEIYRLDISAEDFKAAPGIDLSKWVDAGRSDQVAATYRHFDREPYFLEEGDKADKKATRPKVPLGYVERSSQLLEMPVGNFQGEKFGKVWSLTLDIAKGRILSVIVLAPGNFKTKTVIPAMALSFNDKRDELLLDSTKIEYRDEPRYVFTAAAHGQDAYSEEESYQGKRTRVALEQGGSYRDVDLTVRIRKDIRTAKLNARNVQVGTMDGRVTLRGWVASADDKTRIGDIAIAASRLEVVDNQITVGKPVGMN